MRHLLVAVVVVGLGVARAEPPPGMAGDEYAAQLDELSRRLQDAGEAGRVANRSKSLEDHDRCGEAYLAVAETSARLESDHRPEALYDAAFCFAQGGSADRALALLDELIRTYPRDRLVIHALARAAQLEITLGEYAGAATRLERVATRFPGERDAFDALNDAIWLRTALGDTRAVDRDVDYFIKVFGRKRTAEAASLMLRRGLRLRDAGKRAEAIGALERWLKLYGGKSEPVQLAYGRRALGELVLEGACPVKLVHGLCLKPAPAAARCAPGAPPVAVARKPREVERATAWLGQAAQTDDGAGLALANLYLEATLAVPPPPPVVDASGQLTPASLKATGLWMSTWQRTHATAQRELEAAMRSKSPQVAIAAMGRVAWLTLLAGDTLVAAPLPAPRRGVSDERWRPAYCERLREAAAPMLAGAEHVAQGCLAKAHELGLVDEAALCHQVYERFHPAGHELRPQAAWPVVRDLERPVSSSPP